MADPHKKGILDIFSMMIRRSDFPAEVSVSVMSISGVSWAPASVTARVPLCQTSVAATITVNMITGAIMENMTQSPEKMRLI